MLREEFFATFPGNFRQVFLSDDVIFGQHLIVYGSSFRPTSSAFQIFFVGCICLSSEVFLYLKLTLEFGFFDWLEYVIARFV